MEKNVNMGLEIKIILEVDTDNVRDIYCWHYIITAHQGSNSGKSCIETNVTNFVVFSRVTHTVFYYMIQNYEPVSSYSEK